MSIPTTPPRLYLVLAGDDRTLAGLLDEQTAAVAGSQRDARVIDAPPAAAWPFRHPFVPPLPPGPLVIRAAGTHAALESGQPPHVRLVTTQAQYLFCEWEAALDAHGQATLVAALRLDVVDQHAEDVRKRRGVFRRAVLVDRPTGPASPGRAAGPALPVAGDPVSMQVAALGKAIRAVSGAERLALAVEALGYGRTPPALLAAASACQEVNDLEGAARDLDEALVCAPEWAAAHFERGKVCLRRDDMAGAARAFQAAAERLPRYGGAWGNLGATLGELDRPGEALSAFERLLALDPDNPQAVNNLGVVTRELGRLAEAEAAFRRVITLEPAMAFGYYNLGHALFLQGRYHAAATAYTEGQARDPEKNPVQASRLAMCHLATGDAGAALDGLQRAAAALPPDVRQQVLADASALFWALVTQSGSLAGWQPLRAWLDGELARAVQEAGGAQ